MQTQSDFNFEDFQKEAIKGMYEGKPLNGEKGIFAPLLKYFLEVALQGYGSIIFTILVIRY